MKIYFSEYSGLSPANPGVALSRKHGRRKKGGRRKKHERRKKDGASCRLVLSRKRNMGKHISEDSNQNKKLKL